MRAYLFPVLCGALVLQGAFAASLEGRSPAMNKASGSPSLQSVAYDAMALSHVAGGKDHKARRSDPRVPRVFFNSSAKKVNSEASYGHLGVRVFDTPYEATTSAHVAKHGVKGRMTRRSEAPATSDPIGVETETDLYWDFDSSKNPPQVPGSTASLHRRGRNPSASPWLTETTPSRSLTAHNARQSQGWHPSGLSALTLDGDSPGIGHGGGPHGGGGDNQDQGAGKKIVYGGGNQILYGKGNKIGYKGGNKGKPGKCHNSKTAGLSNLGGGDKIGHGGGDNAGHGKRLGGGRIGHGGGNNLGPGEGITRRSVAEASSDLITSEVEINHDGGHGDDGHTRQSEAPMLPNMPRSTH